MSWRLRGLAATVVMAGVLALIGYRIGLLSAFATVICLVLLHAGGLSAALRRAEAPPGWFAYLVIAGAHGLVTALVFAGIVTDLALIPLFVPTHTFADHVVMYVTVQGLFLAAFLAGRSFARRYQALAAQVDEANRQAARRTALLDEARAEYRRALASGRSGIFSGHTVGGFRLGELIGRGGAGEIYDAVQLHNGTRTVVKLLRADRLGDAETVQRFLQETEVAPKVKSPFLPMVVSSGQLAEGLPYLAMERVEGEDLADLVAARGPLSSAELRCLVGDATAALEAIHARGLLHLDVSPRNLVRTPAGNWKLLDLGGARPAGQVEPGEDAPTGTPRYLAPERLVGAADVRADLYGLSACLYLAASGHEPFAEVSPAALASAIVEAEPADPRPGGRVAADLAHALKIGLAKAPADRFSDAAELRLAFLGALDGALEARFLERGRLLAQRAAWSAPPEDGGTPSGPPPVAERARSVVPPWKVVGGTETTEVSQRAWDRAYREKMDRIYAAVAVLSLGGIAFGIFVPTWMSPTPRLVGMVAGSAILGAAWVHRAITRRRPDARVYWLFALAGALSVGPAYGVGLHSGFAALMTIILFAGGLFRATRRAGTWRDSRGLVLAGIVGAHAAAFVLVMTGVLPDRGVAPVIRPGVALWEAPIIEAVLLGVYGLTFAAGWRVDRRFAALTREAERAAQAAAHEEALLATARAELQQVLADEAHGLFSGLQVGSFALGRVLGRGGMGEVYEATRLPDGPRAAVKLIRADRVDDAANLARFATEAKALARVRSPYVARILEVGGSDPPYIAMELVEGISLAMLLRRRDRLGFEALRALIRDVARGLEDVHRSGVLHRDMKPANLVLTGTGDDARWKLVDFGVARVVTDSRSTGRVVVGTPEYMAPEQLGGGAVDQRSDLYSFGLVIYRALTGRPPFTDLDRFRPGRKPVDPVRLVTVPEDVALALRITLAEQPGDRFATASELGAAFDAAIEGRLRKEVRERGRELAARDPWRSGSG